MKLLPTFALAALLTAGTAFASTAPTATPASGATPAATHTKHNSAMHCEKEAKAKKLSGDDEKKFVKECRAGKAS
jgi:hypothetical protein